MHYAHLDRCIQQAIILAFVHKNPSYACSKEKVLAIQTYGDEFSMEVVAP